MSSIVIKVIHNDDIRRFSVAREVTLDELKAKVSQIVDVTAFKLRYKDSDGDLIVLATQADLLEALKALDGALRLYVSPLQQQPPISVNNGQAPDQHQHQHRGGHGHGHHGWGRRQHHFGDDHHEQQGHHHHHHGWRHCHQVKSESNANADQHQHQQDVESDAKPTSFGCGRGFGHRHGLRRFLRGFGVDIGESQPAQADEGTPLQLHPNVICDGCRGGIVGSRFKCVVCPDFDLCSQCENRGLHSQHSLLRIRSPRGSWRCWGRARPEFANQQHQFEEKLADVTEHIARVVFPEAQTQQDSVQQPSCRGWRGQRRGGCCRSRCQPQETEDNKPQEHQFSSEHHQQQDEETAPDLVQDQAASQASFDLKEEEEEQDAFEQEFAAELAALGDMGFVETDELIPLLRKYDGHLARVIADLVARRA